MTLPPFPVGQGRYFVPEEVRALANQVENIGRQFGSRLGRQGATDIATKQAADLALEIAEKALTARRLLLQSIGDQDKARAEVEAEGAA